MTPELEEGREDLFQRYASDPTEAVRNELVESYIPLAEFFAKRYKNRGAEQEDLRQVAKLALVGSVERFDPTIGVKFSTFAGRTIDGELKRYFRDKMWAVRVPRSLKERSIAVRKANDRLAIDLGRPPTIAELGADLDLEADEVIEALEVQTTGFRADSLERPVGDSDGLSLGDLLPGDAKGIEHSEIQMAVRTLLEALPARERKILVMRFFEEKSQQEIADEIGVSQMHVSRLLRKTLEDLRERMR
ncbi:MAG: SigB/SigF/SigG family RNA polymerase sigma factor [Acidimicrobiales bacterium]|nr:SigB/SigF/SigG family RNA polymerase sigma factor [Acidimicrobiales bacterium]